MRRPTTKRQRELERALDMALNALWDIDGLCELIQQNGEFHKVEFDNGIRSAVRMIEHRAGVVTKQIEVVP